MNNTLLYTNPNKTPNRTDVFIRKSIERRELINMDKRTTGTDAGHYKGNHINVCIST